MKYIHVLNTRFLLSDMLLFNEFGSDGVTIHIYIANVITSLIVRCERITFGGGGVWGRSIPTHAPPKIKRYRYFLEWNVWLHILRKSVDQTLWCFTGIHIIYKSKTSRFTHQKRLTGRFSPQEFVLVAREYY